MIKLTRSIVGKTPKLGALGKVETSQVVPDGVVSIEQINLTAADDGPP